MTKKEAISIFEIDHLEILIATYGTDDGPAFSEAWNNFVDHLARTDSITMHQASTWTHPKRFTCPGCRRSFPNPA